MLRPPLIQSLPDALARDKIARIIRVTHLVEVGLSLRGVLVFLNMPPWPRGRCSRR